MALLSTLEVMKMPKGPIFCWCGVLVILSGAFMLVVDDLNGGHGERMMSFWIYEAVNLLVGALLVILGVRLMAAGKS